MSAKVQLLVGPARSGKTVLLLDRYRAVLRDNLARSKPGANLWLTPTNRARRSLLAAIPDDSLPVFFAPNILTFDEFADRVLSYSGLNLRPLSESARRLVTASIVSELREQGQLEYFRPIAETSGFVDLASAFITELKRNETWPEQFRDACAPRGASAKDNELALIYERYQLALNQHSLYDPEGRFWSARSVIKEGGRAPFQDLSLVVVDGFADFTRTQYEILAHLAEWADELVISLPQESSGTEESRERPDLFAKSSEACERIRELVGGRVERIEPSSKVGSSNRKFAAADVLARSLFVNPRSIEPEQNAEGLEILAVVGQRGEVRAIADRVKRLLLAGVNPTEIVVAIRTLEDYADLVIETFTDAGIPFDCAPAGTLAQAPPIKALLGLLQIEAENWSFERVKGVILSNYVCLAGSETDSAPHRARVVAAIRKVGVAEGRDAFLKALDEAIARAENSAEPDDARGSGELDTDSSTDFDADRRAVHLATLAREARPEIERLSLLTKSLRKKQTFAEWGSAVTALASNLGMIATGSEAAERNGEMLSERDARTWEQFRDILFDASRALELLELSDEKLDLAEFTDRLVDLLSHHHLPAVRVEAGRVLVLVAADIRNLDIPHLFLAGLTEGSFPRGRQEDCLYNEAERQSLNENGLGLRHRSGHNQDEMLLFYQIVTRAQRSLVISYPSVSTSGQPLFPSPYVGAIRDLFTPEALPLKSIGHLDPVPPMSEMLTLADLRLVATESVRDKEPGLFRTFADLPAGNSTARNILAAVDMADSRFHQKGFGAYEGRLEADWIREILAGYFPAAHQFSATQLERYAGCGFRFLMSDVLGVEPLESMATQTDYLTRGLTVHDVLAEVHREEDANDSRVRGTWDEVAIVDRFRGFVDSALRRRPGRTQLDQTLQQIERELLHDWAEAYGIQWTEYREQFGSSWTIAPLPSILEKAFGNVPGMGAEKGSGALAALKFGAESAATFVRGRIDRIDIGHCDGVPVFNVIDYKIGKPPRFSKEEIESGSALQLALYTIAVMRHELAGVGAKPIQFGYWSLRETGYVSGLKKERKGATTPASPEFIAEIEQILETVVPRLAAGIRSGNFAVDSDDPDCTGFCPYSTVCRINQIRKLSPHLEKFRPGAVPVSASDDEAGPSGGD